MTYRKIAQYLNDLSISTKRSGKTFYGKKEGEICLIRRKRATVPEIKSRRSGRQKPFFGPRPEIPLSNLSATRAAIIPAINVVKRRINGTEENGA
jgi:hypothetical protein